MERSRAPVARDRFASYRSAERPRARQHRRPSAEFGGGETSCDACSKVLAISAEPAKSGNGGARLSAVVHRRGGQARSDIAAGTLMLVCGFTFLRLEPIPRAAPMLARHAVVDFGKST